MRMQRRCTARAAAADDQHIRRMVGRDIDRAADGAVPLKQGRQFDHGLVAFVRTESDRSIRAGAIVRVIFMNQLIAVGRGKFGDGLLAASIPGLMNNLLKCVNIHVQRSTTSSCGSQQPTGDSYASYFTVAQCSASSFSFIARIFFHSSLNRPSLISLMRVSNPTGFSVK